MPISEIFSEMWTLKYNTKTKWNDTTTHIPSSQTWKTHLELEFAFKMHQRSILQWIKKKYKKLWRKVSSEYFPHFKFTKYLQIKSNQCTESNICLRIWKIKFIANPNSSFFLLHITSISVKNTLFSTIFLLSCGSMIKFVQGARKYSGGKNPENYLFSPPPPKTVHISLT